MADEKQRIIEFDETSHINADDHVLIDGATAGTRSLKVSDLPGGGSSGVQDVLVDNVSVVDNEIASIDLSGKQDALTAGSNITIDNNVISAENTTYTAGDNIQISNENEISATDTTYSAGTNVSISAQNEISATDTTYTAGANVQISNENVISATDTTYSTFSGSDPGLVPSSDNTSQTKFLRGDGSWQDVSGGGSDVSVTQVQSTGAKIATITVDSVDTDLYAPNDSVTQTEVNVGSYEILLSNNTSGDVKKNAGFFYNVNDSIYGGQLVCLKSAEGNDVEPHFNLWNEVNRRAGYGDHMEISSSDISISSTTAHQVHAATWDGTNESLRAAFSSMWLFGTTTPIPAQGRNGSIYYKVNETGDAVVNVYVKLNNTWLPYQLPTPTPPAAETLLYNWDFTESMIDSVEGLENLPGGGIADYSYVLQEVTRDNEKGLCIGESYSGSAPMAMIPVDLRLPGYKVEIEFGECEMGYGGDDEYPALIASYCDAESWEQGEFDSLDIRLSWQGEYSSPAHYPTHYSGGLSIYAYPRFASLILDNTVVDTNTAAEPTGDPQFFANSKFTLITKAHTATPSVIDPANYSQSSEFYADVHQYEVAWEIYKDDVKVGETPSVVTGFYNTAPQGVSDPAEATYPSIYYATSAPAGYFKGILFGVPCQAGSAGIEIKTLKIYRINNQS